MIEMTHVTKKKKDARRTEGILSILLAHSHEHFVMFDLILKLFPNGVLIF